MPLPAMLGQLLARELSGALLDAVLGELQRLDVHADVVLDDGPLKRLQRGIRRAVLIGVNRAAKPTREAVKAGAESIKRHGFTARAIGTKTRQYPANLAVVAVVGPKMSFSRQTRAYTRGPRKGEPRKHIPYLYSWLLEKGTKRSAAKPYIRPAADRAGAEFPNRVAAAVAAEVARLLGT